LTATLLKNDECQGAGGNLVWRRSLNNVIYMTWIDWAQWKRKNHQTVVKLAGRFSKRACVEKLLSYLSSVGECEWKLNWTRHCWIMLARKSVFDDLFL